ncbi:hypothetical protein PN4B1_29810 [Paenibacillus naphthalenovorans]|uniref:hypothetical protein n=1 Tax=Paenibacillus naphthalenovorans TaxID=162209 RepID=UPI0010BAD984|nr:hypothetical protein [Paenibacillus naphthalenovorans]GCL73045.1 hypothetical protein PN4B1_29810 [Paenibacillus naphthalenovorans]
MDKFLTYVGGLIGGYVLIKVPVEEITALSGLNTILDVVGSLAVIVFGGTLVVRGVLSLLGK